jgi:hypothetical protein
MTEAELLAMRELCDAATPGDWKWDNFTEHREPERHASELISGDVGIMESWDYEGYSSGIHIRPADAAFIAAARQFIPKAIATIEALKAKLSFTDGDRLANELPGD